MFSTFDQAKEELRKQYQEHHWDPESGLDGETLEANCRELLSHSEGKSGLRKKTDLLCYLLRNARVEVHPAEFFADKIDHRDIVWRLFQSHNVRKVEAECAGGLWQEHADLIRSTAINPSMDFGHLAPDWGYVLREGLPGMMARLTEQKASSAEDSEKIEFYDCCIETMQAVCDCFLRMAQSARRLQTEKGDFLAENLEALTRSAPKTLAQGIQLTLLYYEIQTKMDLATVRSLGGLDRLYIDLYREDLRSGRFSEAQLRELVRDFFWKCCAKHAIANLPFYLGGKLEDGRDACNELTYLLLEEYRGLDIHDPKIHLFLHKNSPERLKRTALESIRAGQSSIVFVNVDVAEEALRRVGIAEEDARRVIVYGCYETAAEGTEIPATCGGRINLAKGLEYALFQGFDPVLGRQVGLSTAEEFATFEDFYQAVKAQIGYLLSVCMEIISRSEPEYSWVNPSPMLSAGLPHCVATGREAFSGGAKYNNTSIVCGCLASIVDGLAAVRKVVFEDRRVSLPELREILRSDWEKDPQLQKICAMGVPKYGNNNCKVDDLASDLLQFLAGEINGRPNGRGGVYRFGMFSIDWRLNFGKVTGATPDGRRRGEPLSKNFCASLGQDRRGVTALLHSSLRADMGAIPDGCVLDLVFHASSVAGEDGLTALLGVLDTYFSQDGFALQMNVLDPTVLRKAQKSPENYKNLQIRLCGWNVHFVDLSPQEQEEFILQAGAH